MEDSAVLHTDIPKLAVDANLSDIAGRQNADGTGLLYCASRRHHQRRLVPDDVPWRETTRTTAEEGNVNIPIFSFLYTRMGG